MTCSDVHNKLFALAPMSWLENEMPVVTISLGSDLGPRGLYQSIATQTVGGIVSLDKMVLLGTVHRHALWQSFCKGGKTGTAVCCVSSLQQKLRVAVQCYFQSVNRCG